MKFQVLVSILFLSSAFNLQAQKKYSFGTDYTLIPGYKEEKDEWSETALMVGLAATREISLKSHLLLGVNYFQTKANVGDSLYYRRKYLEVPLFLKVNFLRYDRTFKWHMITGLGTNMLIADRKITKVKSGNEKVSENQKLKFDAVSFSYGLGFDIKITKAFYLGFDGLFRFYYHSNKKRIESSDGWSITPGVKGGIFVWLN
jgi:hypothetical protein